jgi:hypothetical protein
MAKIDKFNDKPSLLFNSQLETGIRSLVILEAAYPDSYDLNKLTWLDHLVVHTGDISGPASLHPKLPQRSGEMLVRRRLIEEGLILMRRFHLINAITDSQGISYQATDEAYVITQHMRTEYSKALIDRAKWVVEKFSFFTENEFRNFIIQKIGRWNIEFQEESIITKDDNK